MQYMGSKRLLFKHIYPIIKEYRSEGSAWVEPFVGGGNMIDKVEGKRIGNDLNKYVISLLKAAQNDYIFPTAITKDLYYQIKENESNYESYIYAFVGFLCSFGGKWWGGYASNKRGDNYAKQSSNSIKKQGLKLKGVEFQNVDYRQMIIPDNSVIYCDPPYKGATGYKDPFDHNAFWGWCRQKSKQNHKVFISEYSAPDDFECIFSKIHNSTLNNRNNHNEKIERLFTYRL